MKDFPVIAKEVPYYEAVPNQTLAFSLGCDSAPATGIDFLMQLVVKGLFTTPGSSVFSPNFGVGITSRLGFSANLEKSLVFQATIKIKSLEDQIKQIQAGQNISSDERLNTLEVVEYMIEDQTLKLKLRVWNEDRMSKLIGVGIPM